jgi:nucleotide-binding universal stress UspA family protein
MTASSATIVDTIQRQHDLSALPRHLVVGVDGTDSSLRALELVATVARRNESEVTVAFVRHFPTFTGTVAVDWSAVFASVEAEIAQAARKRLAGLRWQMLISDGSPALELERLAREVGADLLVVGQSRRTDPSPARRFGDGSRRHPCCGARPGRSLKFLGLWSAFGQEAVRAHQCGLSRDRWFDAAVGEVTLELGERRCPRQRVDFTLDHRDMDEGHTVGEPEGCVAQAPGVVRGQLGVDLLHELLVLITRVDSRRVAHHNHAAHRGLLSLPCAGPRSY